MIWALLISAGLVRVLWIAWDCRMTHCPTCNRGMIPPAKRYRFLKGLVSCKACMGRG